MKCNCALLRLALFNSSAKSVPLGQVLPTVLSFGRAGLACRQCERLACPHLCSRDGTCVLSFVLWLAAVFYHGFFLLLLFGIARLRTFEWPPTHLFRLCSQLNYDQRLQRRRRVTTPPAWYRTLVWWYSGTRRHSGSAQRLACLPRTQRGPSTWF